ncbi:TPA: Lar family restriction alleviation protein [Citrobacter freundii]
MTTFTKEQLIEQAKDNLLGLKNYVTVYPERAESEAMNIRLIEIALAALTADPVAWTDAEELRDANVAGIGYLFGIEKDANKFADPRRQIMLYRHAQPAPVVPDAVNGLMPCPFCGGKAHQLTIEQDDDPHFGGDVITCTECGASSHVEFGFKENLKSAWNSRTATLQAGNSPVIGIDLASGPDRTVEVRYVAPPGYVMVPKEPTEAMINAWLSEVANWRGHVAGYKAALAAAPQQENV